MEPTRGRRIGVLVGGDPPEREISVRSGDAVVAALEDAGHDARALFVDRDIDLLLRQERIDVAFLALRGRAAGGAVQGLLETLGIAYTGSSLAAAALASDRLRTTEQLRLHNLPAPPYYRHSRGMGGPIDQHGSFGFPCVVRPRAGGPGVGVALVHDPGELATAVELALRIDDEVLVERHAGGLAIEVILLDGQVLGAAEVTTGRSRGGAPVDFATLHGPGRLEVQVPPRLGSERLRGVLTQAVRAYHLLGCDGAGRVEVFVSERENEQITEVDVLPDLAQGSIFPTVAATAGLGFQDLVVRMLGGARLHGTRRVRERREMQLPHVHADRRIAETIERH